jgi:hypothetical protein
MQQSEFFGQLALPSFTARAPKKGSKGYGQIDNRALQAKPQLAGLKRQDMAIHHHLLSLPDDWNYTHLGCYLANHYEFSRSTAFRIIGRLLDAGLLARIWCQKTRTETYQVFEVPCPGRPTGKEARKRHVVTSAKLGTPGHHKSPSMPRKHHGYLIVEDAGPAFLRHERGVSKLRRLQRTEEDYLISSDNPSTPPAPKGAQESLDDFRVCRNEGTPDKPARRAKRQKGRSSPGRPHNAREMKPKHTTPKAPRLSRLAINLGNYRATPDAYAFMQNLATQLKPARQALRDLPEPNTQAWVDALMANPILSVAQDVFGYTHWGASELRSFVKSLGRRIPIYDLLLCWIGVQGNWSPDRVYDMRQRLTKRRQPTEPDYRRSQVCPDLMMEVYNWHLNVDGVRESLYEQCTKAVNELRAGVDLDNPETIVTHPMIWTAILASPLPPEEVIDADVVALARETLVPVSAAVMGEWIDKQSARMLCRWNGRFCSGDIEVLIGRGICRVVEEWYEFDMVNMSGRQGVRNDYSHATEARTATLPSFD